MNTITDLNNEFFYENYYNIIYILGIILGVILTINVKQVPGTCFTKQECYYLRPEWCSPVRGQEGY